MDQIKIRPAIEGDAAQIADLFCRDFHPAIRQLLIYGCAGAANYIRRQIASRTSFADSAYFIAQSKDRAIAAVELRQSPDGTHLNYIAVHPDYQRRHMGTELFLTALRMCSPPMGRVSLDVFDDNLRALRWYGRLGFRVRQTSELIELMTMARESAGRTFLSGLPQADLCQESFGFSEFRIITKQGKYPVGRIGEQWFRLTDPASFSDPSVFTGLKMLDCGRRIFAVAPASTVPPKQVVRTMATMHRMDVEIRRLLSSLINDCEKSRESA